MPLLDEIIAGRRTQTLAAGSTAPDICPAELTQDDIETILRMVREQEREDATTGSTAIHAGRRTRRRKWRNRAVGGCLGLDQVNGFPSGRAFDLAPEGMTIFFGHNGAGKSGYARVFKNACNARHRVEVLPDAFGAATPARPPSADFAILVDGTPETARWVQNGRPICI